MDNFFNTLDTIDGSKVHGFDFFGPEHIAWLLIMITAVITLSTIYCRGCDHGCGSECPRRLSGSRRRKDGQKLCRHGMRMVIAMLLIADELLKYTLVTINGAPIVKYIPLQLCSLCIIISIVHAFFRPHTTGSMYLGNFLYLIGIASGLSALLFPSWSALPAFNLMSIHSFSAHILLLSYIVMVLSAKEIEISAKTIPVSVLALFAMAGGIYLFNLAFGTNFMYLMHISPGSPIAGFESLGDYRIGYFVILACLIIILYGGRALIMHLTKKS